MGLLSKFKDSFKEKGVSLPISENMLHELIKKSDKVKDTTLTIKDGLIFISGKAEVEKLFVKKDVSFSIKLLPVKMENREIYFEIKEFKPLNVKSLNKKIFTQPPYFTFKDERIVIDFNSWDIVRKVPFGNIKKYNISEGKITITIGI